MLLAMSNQFKSEAARSFVVRIRHMDETEEKTSVDRRESEPSSGVDSRALCAYDS